MNWRRAALALAVIGLAAAAAFAWVAKGTSNSTSVRAERPNLLILTSLPLLFSEDFSLEGSKSPVIATLERRYRLVPISVTSAAELGKGRLLLMAHPLAQGAENLVELDRWVRAGGKVMLLADPMLEWPSALPLGDPLRPPPMFMDTGLLSHWGVRLHRADQRGALKRQLGARTVTADSPGRLTGACSMGSDGFVAKCRIGNGFATIVADADFLSDPGGEDGEGAMALLAQLGLLESR